MNSKTYLEPEEIARMEEVAGNLRDRLLVRFLFRTGCRVSEVLGLTVEDINLDGGNVTIRHLKSRFVLYCSSCNARLGAGHIFCPKCSGKVDERTAVEQQYRRQRNLPVDEGTMDMIGEFTKRGGPVSKQGKKLIFGINRHRAWQIVRDCAEKAGLSQLVNIETGRIHNVSPHRLRDAFAVHAMKTDDSGDGLRLLQEHLGHQSFNTTARCRKISGQELRDWYKVLWEGVDDD